MSVLVMRKRPGIVETEYQIVKQSPKLELGPILFHSPFHGVKIGGYSFPDFTTENGGRVGHLKIRGQDPSQNHRWFTIPAGWAERAEMAVLEFNLKFGNNKDIDVEDVIWQE
jgi:hypothetical protein